MSLTLSQLLNQGRVAYAEQRYSQAVEDFSKALRLTKGSAGDQLTTLDHRCQAYSKLSKHDLALQDARSMIRAGNRQDFRGYLRCSQIERLTGNYAAAIHWLEHGVKNVPKHRSLFAANIEKISKLANDSADLQKRRDPITILPLEVLELILSQLAYREIVCLLRISRAWRYLLSGLPPLTTQLDFSGARRRVSCRCWIAAVKRLRQKPQKIVLAPLAASATDVVKLWLSKSVNVEQVQVLHFNNAELRLTTAHLDKLLSITSLQSGAEQELSLPLVVEKILTRPILHEAIVHVIGKGVTVEPLLSNEQAFQKQLKRLHLHGHLPSATIFPAALLARFPNLESLSIISMSIQPSILNLHDHHNLCKLRLHPVMLQTLDLHLPDSIEELHCGSGFQDARNVSLKLIEPCAVPHLHTLMIESSWAFAILDALRDLRLSPVLSKVKLERVGKDFLTREASQNYNILSACRDLSFSPHDMTDRDYDKFSALFPDLESLEIEAPLITGVFVSDLVKRPSSRITRVVLKDCRAISPDITQWLANRDIECRVITSRDNPGVSRHVRETW